MMIAIPLHQSRVAPVLDWCSMILLLPNQGAESWHDGERLRVKTNIFELLRLLRNRAVSSVICGALSPHALRFGQHLGLEFICGISGTIDEVIEAYRVGVLDQPRFRLPGCRCMVRPRLSNGTEPHDQGSEQCGFVMAGDRGAGRAMLRQGGQGRSRGWTERGCAMGGAVCVCPQCGMEVPHRPGIPCTRSVCQVCGISLVRKPSAPGSSL